MVRKRRFIVAFSKYRKETFLSLASDAKTGIDGNPDFADGPVTALAFKAAYDAMVTAAPNAVRNNIDGLRIFTPLRNTVEGMMTQLGNYGQSTIGDNPTRMVASQLPLSKIPTSRSENINIEVGSPKLLNGSTVGKIDISVKPYKAADGIIIYVRQPDLTYVERAKVLSFKTTLSGFTPEEVVVVQICYWNKEGNGPLMGRPLAIVV